MSVIAYDAPHMPFSLKNINYNSPNIVKSTVSDELKPNQPPLGSQFNNYELNQAVNYYTLDPFQYSITKFNYKFPDGRSNTVTGTGTHLTASPDEFTNNPGIVYRDINFEKLLPSYTSTKKSVNDFKAQSYHRFEANDGYFNPNESVNNTDLWYYGASDNARLSDYKIAGAPLNVQEINHIIFPEAQRGGSDSRSLAKYSWPNFKNTTYGSFEEIIVKGTVNDERCKFFNYNSNYTTDRNAQPFDKVYSFDSNYGRAIGITPLKSGSMPFNPSKIN